MKSTPDPRCDTTLDTSLAVRLGDCRLRTPLLTASGTCGYGPEYAEVLDYGALGGFTTKSVTLHERPGNQPERIVETQAGMLNAIGLANVGLERFLVEKLPFIREMPTQVFVNVAGHAIDDYVAVCERLDGEEGLAGIELNVSCPNVADGLTFGTDPKLLLEVTRAVRAVIKRGVFMVKLSPNVTDITALARAAVEGGADVLSLINTYVGLSINSRTYPPKPSLANVTGGLSGPAIKPLALFNIHRVYREVAKGAGVPLLGMGGVTNARDALELMFAGATAVAIGTALFVDPGLPAKIPGEIAAFVREHGLGSVGELVGALEV